MALFGITLDEWFEAFSTGGISLIMGTKKHNHHEHNSHLCETHLGLCKRCDVVYCVECGKEWGHCKLTHSPYTYVYPQYTQPYRTGDNIIFTDGTAGISSDTISESTGAAGVTANEVKFVPTACSHA